MNAEPHIRMLSVDDRSLTSGLERAGYREMGVLVVAAASRDAALTALEARAIDVVVINLDHVKVDGFLLTMDIRAHHLFGKVPIVMTSVESHVKDRDRIEAVGVDLFVHQPVPRSIFIEKIKNLLTQTTRENLRINSTDLGEAEVVFEGRMTTFPIADVSATGMFLAAGEPMTLGAELRVSFYIPTYKGKITTEATVVRHVVKNPMYPDRPQGFGVRFKDLPETVGRTLRLFLESAHLNRQELQYYL